MGEITVRFDLLIIGFLLPASEVGIYVAAVGIAQMLWIIPSAAGEIALAETTRAGAPGHARFLLITGRYIWSIAAVTAVGALCIFFLAPSAISLLLGDAYATATEPLRLLLPGMVFYSIATIGGNALAGRGRIGRNLIVSLTTAAVTLLGNIWLIPTLGISGAAIVSSSAYLLAAILVMGFVQQLRRTSVRELGVV